MRPLTDDEAWIVEHNLNLVHAVIGPWKIRPEHYEDIRQAAYMGLCRAIQSFDPARSSWSTYACQWINSYARQCVESLAFVRLPRYLMNEVSPGRKDRAVVAIRERNLKYAERWRRGPILWRSDEVQTVAVLAVSHDEHEDDRLERLRREIDRLPERYRTVVMRCGLEGRTLKAVAAEMGCTIERVRQIKQKSLELIRLRMRRHPD